MNKTLLRPLMAAFALVFVFIGVLLVLAKRTDTLLPRSHRVASVGPWPPGECSYFWLSSRDVLLVQPGPPTVYGDKRVQVSRIDTLSGARTPMSALEGLLNKEAVNGHVANWQISPDGGWLLAESDQAHSNASWHAISVDNCHEVVRPHQYDEQEYDPYNKQGLIHAVWRLDSRGWVQVAEENNKAHIYLYDFRTPAVVEHTEDFMLYDRNVIGCYGPDRVLAVNRNSGDYGAVSYADFSAVPTAKSRVLYFQYAPANMNVRQAALSPSRDRIAWIFEVRPVPFGIKSKALENSSFVRRSAPTKVGIWTSKLDCSDLRNVGMVDVRGGSPSDLRWVPDGKRLSFVYQNVLYTVPAG